MKRYMSICLILLFYLIFVHKLHAGIHSSGFTEANLVLESKGQQVKVVSFNMHFAKGIDGQINLDRTIDTLKEIAADIICLQEVERLSARSGFIDQAGKIAQELEMDFVFIPSLTYPGFYYGNAILSRYPILDTTSILLTSSTENRTALLAEIQFAADQNLMVMTTHLGLEQELYTFYDQSWQIDYIFHSAHFTTTDTWVHPSEASDHLPLVAQLHLN